MRTSNLIALAILSVLLPGCGRNPEPAAQPDLPKLGKQAKQAAAKPSGRAIYPYSVIPGGVGSKDELQEAIATDAVVAAHYSGIDVKALKPLKLTHDVMAYVSYRRHGTVYWTSRRVRLAAGEFVFKSGGLGVRSRCGNQVSETPRTPVVPEGTEEPSGATFDTPIAGFEIATDLGLSRTGLHPWPVSVASENQGQTSIPAPELGWSNQVPGISAGPTVLATGGGSGGARRWRGSGYLGSSEFSHRTRRTSGDAGYSRHAADAVREHWVRANAGAILSRNSRVDASASTGLRGSPFGRLQQPLPGRR